MQVGVLSNLDFDAQMQSNAGGNHEPWNLRKDLSIYISLKLTFIRQLTFAKKRIQCRNFYKMALQKSKVMIAIDICFVKENCLHPFSKNKGSTISCCKDESALWDEVLWVFFIFSTTTIRLKLLSRRIMKNQVRRFE